MSAAMEPEHPLANPYGGMGPAIMAATWVQAALAISLMGLRTYTNAAILKSFRWDYWWASLTLVMSMTTQIMLTVSCVWGMGNHLPLLTTEQTKNSLEWSWIGQMILIQSIGVGKIAVVAFLLRIQAGLNTKKTKYLSWLLYFIAVSNVAINLDQLALILSACSPIGKLWDPILPGTCNGLLRASHVGYFQGGWAALSDITLALYPILVFWSVQISTKIKLGLCGLMAGGLLAAGAGIAKTVYLHLISTRTDVTYDESPLLIWAWTENWLVLILGCLPPLNALFLRIFYRVSTTGVGSKQNSGYRQHYSNSGGGPRSNHRSIQLNNFSNPYHSTKNNVIDNDDDSEKNILPGMPPGSKDIMRTTHVHVARANKEEAEAAPDTNDAYSVDRLV